MTPPPAHPLHFGVALSHTEQDMASIHYMDEKRAIRANYALQQRGYDAELLPNLQRGMDIFHLLKVNPEDEHKALDHLRRHDLLGDLEDN
jgi:hypothetical protein